MINTKLHPLISARLLCPQDYDLTTVRYTRSHQKRILLARARHPPYHTDVLVELTQGYWSLCSPNDLPEILKHNWRAAVMKSAVRAVTWLPIGNGKQRHLFLHQLLCECPEGYTPDHINRVPLDNRKDNLRPASPLSQNLNQAPKKGYIGVSWHAAAGKYQAKARLDGKVKHLGLFDDDQDAAVTRDHALLTHYKDSEHHQFIKLNLPYCFLNERPIHPTEQEAEDIEVFGYDVNNIYK